MMGFVSTDDDVRNRGMLVRSCLNARIEWNGMDAY